MNRLILFSLAPLLLICPDNALAGVIWAELGAVGTDYAELEFTTGAETTDAHVLYSEMEPDLEASVSSVKQKYHRARIEGLKPGKTYVYRIVVDGATAPTDTYNPGSFITLTEPGELLFSFATVTDTHFGEEVCGLVGGMDYKGFTWPDPNNPFWKFTNEATAGEMARTPGLSFLIHKGDLTSSALEGEFAAAVETYGNLPIPTYFARGNHDRPGKGPDYFAQVTGIAERWRKVEFDRHIFLLLDPSDPVSGLPNIREDQFAWFESELKAGVETKRPIWVVLHYAASEKAEFIFTLLGEQQRRFLRDIASASPYVVAVLSGHSHRNIRLDSVIAPGVPFIETAAPKSYPGNWSEVRVYTQGWMQINHVADCPECREWFDITRGTYDGKAQAIQAGEISDRSFVVAFPPELVQEPEEEEMEGDYDVEENAEGPREEGSLAGTNSDGCNGLASGGAGAWPAVILVCFALLRASRKRWSRW